MPLTFYSLQDVDEAKLGLFSGIDSPTLPHNSGLDYFYNRITKEMDQQRREALLDVTKEDLERVAHEYLVTNLENGMSSQVIFGSDNEDGFKELIDAGFLIENLDDHSLKGKRFDGPIESETM